jgi:hypothetical protein
MANEPWLSDLLDGAREIRVDGVAVPRTYAVNLVGANVSTDAETRTTDISLLPLSPNQGLTILILGIGESGMRGTGLLSDAVPAGYPDISGRFSFFGDSEIIALPVEGQENNGPSPVYAVQAEGGTMGYGWAQFALNYLLSDLTPHRIRYLGCAKAGTWSGDWNYSTSTSTLCGAAIARLKTALREPGTVWGGVFVDQGLNDASAGLQTGWASRWTTIVNGIFAEMGQTVPIWYRRFSSTWPTPDIPVQANYNALLAEQDSWASTSPVRRPCLSPTGMQADPLHMTTQGYYTLGATVADAMRAYPPNTATVTTYTPSKKSPLNVGASVWWRASTGGAGTASWVDTIGGYTATQSTPAKVPALVTDAGHGKPGMLFDGSTSCYRIPSGVAALLNGTQAYTIFFNFRPTTLGDWFYFCGSRSDARHELGLGTLGASTRLNSYRVVGGTQYTMQTPTRVVQLGTPCTYAIRWGGTNGTGAVFVNGLWTPDVVDSHTGSLSGMNQGTIGCFSFQASETWFANGYGGDIAIVTSALSNADVRAVSLYLMDTAP